MTWQVGDTYPSAIAIDDPDGPADPDELTFTVQDPEGIRVVYEWPTDADIVQDSEGRFHFDLPLTTAGVWRYQWNSVPLMVEGGPIVVGPAPIDDTSLTWLPTLAQVAALLRSRTRVPPSHDVLLGVEVGMFTDITRPTASEVLELIDLAAGELSGLMQARTPCTADLSRSAATAVAYRAAALVLISFYPEATEAENSAFESLSTMWTNAAEAVSTAVVAACPLVVDGAADETGWPIGRGPTGPLVGRRWPIW